MNKMTKQIVPDEEVFDLGTRRTLADVLAAGEVNLTGTALRDARSAFRFLARQCGVDLNATLARPEELRQIFAGLSPVRLGVREKRLANVRALVASAVARFGMRRTWITREIPLDEVWQDLLDRIPDREHRWGLSRLACYCTVKGIKPTEVDRDTLLSLHAALEAESVSKDPRNLLKHTIAVWNICHRRVPDWPGGPLSSPFKTEPFMLPLEAFPAGFREAVVAFEARMRKPDPLDPMAPRRAYRPDTLMSYRLTFRRAASALVRGSIVPLEDITGSYEMEELTEAQLVAGRGIVGDRYYLGTGTYFPKPDVREVTLIEVKVLEAIGRGEPKVPGLKAELEPEDHRRNLTTRGVPLGHLVGKRFRVGEAVLRAARMNFPCKYIEELLGIPGLYEGLLNRSGLNCAIEVGGVIRLGDPILPVDA